MAEAPGDRCYKAMAMESLYLYIYICHLFIYGYIWNTAMEYTYIYVCMYVCMHVCMYVWSRSESATKRAESATMSRQPKNG